MNPEYEFADAIAAWVAAAPPLTDEQRDRIAAILREPQQEVA